MRLLVGSPGDNKMWMNQLALIREQAGTGRSHLGGRVRKQSGRHGYQTETQPHGEILIMEKSFTSL